VISNSFRFCKLLCGAKYVEINSWARAQNCKGGLLALSYLSVRPSVHMSVHSSVCQLVPPHGTIRLHWIFAKIDNLGFFENCRENSSSVEIRQE
jgi:hypothetical protein